MPRKQKNKLFRRGNNQRYYKFHPVVHSRKNNSVSAKITRKNYFSNIFLVMLSISASYFLIQPVFKNIISIISEVEIAFTIPQISIDTSFIYTAFDQLRSIGKNFLSWIVILNPAPVFLSLFNLITALNNLTLDYIQWTTQMIFTGISYLDPRPGLIILTPIFYAGVQFIGNKLYSLILFLNPLPGILKSWEFTITAAESVLLISTLLLNFLIRIILGIILWSFTIISQIISFLAALVLQIFSAINALFNKLYDGVMRIISSIIFSIGTVADFLSPYVMYIVNTFSGIANEFAKSARSIADFSKTILEQYDKYHPR